MIHDPRVLVVDDDPRLLGALCTWLRYEGYLVDTAPDGETALARLEAEGVDVLLSDVDMPGMSGVQLAERASLRAPELAVVLMSGRSLPSAAERRWPFLLKPFPMDALRELLRRRVGTVARSGRYRRVTAAESAARQVLVERRGALAAR